MDELEFGLQSKGNIVRAIDALLSHNIYCQLDNPSNYGLMGVFMFFDFRSKEEMNRAIMLVAEVIGVGLELEPEWGNTLEEVRESLEV